MRPQLWTLDENYESKCEICSYGAEDESLHNAVRYPTTVLWLLCQWTHLAYINIAT